MKIKILTFILLNFLSASLWAQQTNLPTFLQKLDDVTSENAQEKVYLHLDKPYYAIGDNIWFKAYTVNARNGQPTLKSKILYVELINEKDSVAKQLKLQLRGGMAWGDFKLTDSLSEGNYRIRAYTQWMRNAGPAFFFDKTIKIGNSWANKVFTKSDNVVSIENGQQKVISTIQFTDKQNIPYANREVNYEVQLNNKNAGRGKGTTNTKGEIVVSVINKQPELYKTGFISAKISLPNGQQILKEVPLKTTSREVDVQFFPEGGKLVENLPNKLGVKAINSNGLGELTKGVILNNEGVEVSKFETNSLGMGSFFLNPMPNENYKVKTMFVDGHEKMIDLPRADPSGRVLTVNNTDSTKMLIRVYISENLLNSEECNLVVQHNGIVYFSTKVTANKQVTVLTVPKDSLPSGIIQISLLSANFTPLNERIVFVDNLRDEIDINAETLKPNYEKRGKVDVSVSAMNIQKPVQGSFSVAVTNTTAVKPDPENETNIRTRFLLTSDLVGYVEKPNYYFLKKDKNTRQDLDNLLLTQGWRKTDWKEVSSGQNKPIIYPAEKKMNISGIVTKGGKPVVNGKIMLISFTGGFFATDTLTDDKGKFNFDIEFLDSTKFVVQARTEKERKFVDIVMDIIPGQTVNKNPNTGDIEVNVNQSLADYLAQSGKYFDDQANRGLLNRTILLDAVNIIEKRRPTFESSNLGGAGNADAVITAKDLENSNSLADYLQGRVAGIQIINGLAYARGNQDSMSVMIDGMSYGGEGFSLNDIVVSDIATVEILKSTATTAIYGMSGGAGLIIITTKRGGGLASVNSYTPGLIRYNPKGYALVREFYSPKYDVTPDSRPDFRTTVFWEPQLVTDTNGNGKFSFFNTDVPGIYRMVIEGIDVNGSLARKVLTYEVK